jgi:lactoylglutathione lyase
MTDVGSRLDHVGLAVADLPAAVAWFCDVFGLVPELTLRVEALDLSIEMLLHPGYGYRLELLYRPGSAADGKPGTPAEAALREGYGHVAFDVTDLDAAYDRAVTRGARPVMPPGLSPEPGVRMAFVADPEGNLIELLHRPGLTNPSVRASVRQDRAADTPPAAGGAQHENRLTPGPAKETA